MSLLSFIIWDVNPDIIKIPFLDHPVRWYGMLWALGLIVGQQIMYYIYKQEGNGREEVDKLTLYVIIGTLVGARFGHCIFYDPVYYFSNPIKFLYIWEGGLASHGGGIGLFISLYLFARKYKRKYLWILDRVAIITLLTGAFIRFGNFMNSEIIGIPTESGNGIVFVRPLADILYQVDDKIESVSFEKRAGENEGSKVPITLHIEYKKGAQINALELERFVERSVPHYLKSSYASKHFYYSDHEPLKYETKKDKGVQRAEIYIFGIARHPAQLYEAIACLIFFLIVAHLWYHNRSQLKNGFIFGVFMTLLWTERFFNEFLKENQEAWEADLLINMGQILSIPMFVFGVVVLVISWGGENRI